MTATRTRKPPLSVAIAAVAIAALAVVVGLIVGLVGIGSGAGGGRPGATQGVEAGMSFGRLAGYVWNGPITLVQASWTVPRIVGGPDDGHASTWVGAQAPGATNHSPFIQVGVLEQRSPASSKGPSRLTYEAFWSDTMQGFHPVMLFAVRAGDIVSAALALANGRWRVTVSDARSHARSSFATDDESTARFDLAEWLQEDPTDHNRPLPYPLLSAVRFSRLEVNGAPPAGDSVYSQWMSENGRALAPGTLDADGFALTPAILTAAAKRYLDIATAEDLATTVFAAELRDWTPATARARIARAGSEFAAAMQTSVDQLQRYSWPAAVDPLVRSMTTGARAVVARVRLGERHDGGQLATYRAAFERVAALGPIGRRIRAVLHLPDITPDTSLPGAGTAR